MKDTSSQTKKIIFLVYKFIKDLSEQEDIRPSMFAKSLKVTAEICEMSERTVRRICKEGKDSLKNENDASEECPMFRSPRKTYKREKPLTELDDLNKDLVRRTVYEIYDRGEYPTGPAVLAEVKKTMDWKGSVWAMRTLLKNLKFEFKKCNNGRTFFVEKNDIIAQRCTFLRKICTLREQKDSRPIIYLDETWIDLIPDRTAGLKIPSNKRDRLIVCHAGSTKYGLIDDSKLIFRTTVSSYKSNYHIAMKPEIFKNWFVNTLNLLQEPSVVVMDNAPYHSMLVNNFPKNYSRKADVEEWLKSQNVDFSPQERLSELRERVKAILPVYKRYELDEIAQQMGHEVLRFPLHHCQYNPMELIWKQVKEQVVKKNTTNNIEDVEKLIHEAMDAVTPQNWAQCVAHAENYQGKDNEKEIQRDVTFEPFVLTLLDDDIDLVDADV